ncbi:hypothetical protein [Aerosakkonema funiforme]|uniref:hypothetical protein n=1 Tax=Aerosakkonema funiforme TaxID=1246630 RepID=UPI001688716F|nr:hypothetical protein [Aerosakkonema funiforme]
MPPQPVARLLFQGTSRSNFLPYSANPVVFLRTVSPVSTVPFQFRRPPHKAIISIHREGTAPSTSALSAQCLASRLPVGVGYTINQYHFQISVWT